MNDSYAQFDALIVDQRSDGFWICWPDGERFDGPFQRLCDANKALNKYQQRKQLLLEGE